VGAPVLARQGKPSARSRVMMRSLSTSALGQPSETKLTEGAAELLMFLDRTVMSYSPLQSRSRRGPGGSQAASSALQKPPFLMQAGQSLMEKPNVRQDRAPCAGRRFWPGAADA